jgi:hypothetical protein
MSRRRSVRRPRRVQVQFWKRGEPTAYIGYTTNISMTGMFVATNSPVPQGTRVRVEVMDRDRGFMVEGVVAHARRVQGDLARVLGHSGMGVRFLSVEDLVRELIPAAHDTARQTEEIPRPAAPSPEPPPPPEPAEEHVAPPPPVPPPPAAAPPRPQGGPPVGTSGYFKVHFKSPEDFLEVFRRDIVQGGLFVSTLSPARLMETVTVELHLPDPEATSMLLRARVVQRFPPDTGDPATGPNLLSGMGLELLDLPVVLQRLQPLADLLAG